MQPESNSDHAHATDEFATSSASTAPEKPTRHGRPRVLDDAMRYQIVAFISGGCDLRAAAHFFRCGYNTILREIDRNPEFGDQIRRAEIYAQLSPLRAMQLAIAKHWRAAAWWLERAFPERFSKPHPGAFGAREARELMKEVLAVVSSEMSDSLKSERIAKRLRGTFEYYTRAACDSRRTSRGLRQAMRFYDDKNTEPQPLSEFGINFTDFDTLMKSASASPAAPPTRKPPQPAPRPRPADKAPTKPTESNIHKETHAEEGKRNPDARRGAPNPAPQNPKTQPASATSSSLPPRPADRPLTEPTVTNILKAMHETLGTRPPNPRTEAPNSAPQKPKIHPTPEAASK